MASGPVAFVLGGGGVLDLFTMADVWRELPMDKEIVMHWWLEPPADVPTDPDGRVDWRYSWWISQNRIMPEPHVAEIASADIQGTEV